MQFEFTYTPSELRELTRVATWAQLRWWALLSLYGLLPLLLTAVLAADPAPELLRVGHAIAGKYARPVVVVGCYFASLLFVLVVTVARFSFITRGRRSLLRSPLSLTIDQAGLAWDHEAIHSAVGWAGFSRLIETKRLLAVGLSENKGWIALPKRAVADVAELAAVRRTVAAGLSQRTGGFAVLPVDPPPSDGSV